MTTQKDIVLKETNEDEENSSKFLIYDQEQAFLHMTQRRSEKEQLLYSVTDEILFNVWDAQCISIDQDFREAYLPYLPQAFDLLNNTEDGLDLFDYLVFVEETEMEAYKGDALARQRATRAVDVLLGYRESIFSIDQKNFQKNLTEEKLQSETFEKITSEPLFLDP